MQNLAVLAALGFASARGVQLVVHDTIGDPVRARIEAWHLDGIRPGRRNRLRSFVRDLLGCVYCVGFWLSVLATATYLTAAGEWGGASFFVHAIEAFAIDIGAARVFRRWG